MGGPPRLDPIELAVVANMFSIPLREDRTIDVNDSSATRRLKSFTRRVLKKVDSPLIR